MKNTILTIKQQQRIAPDTCEMVLQAAGTDAAVLEEVRPGQFINIKIDGFYLRRPISICDWDASAGTITIIYKTVGQGTEAMSRMTAGQELDILWPLGNGYDLGCLPQRPLLIGGGAGVPPMYGLCRKLAEAGARPQVILGFRSAADVFYQEKFQSLGARVLITTEDGSAGIRGFVTDAMAALEPGSAAALGAGSAEEHANESAYDGVFACGPEPMLRAVDQNAPAEIPGQMSFEERMGCGFGACMGCSCETKYGAKRICKDGPVLERSEIIW